MFLSLFCSQSQVTKPSTHKKKKCNLVNCSSHFHVADKWEFIERAIQLPIRLFKAKGCHKQKIKIYCNFLSNTFPILITMAHQHTFKEKVSPIEFSSTLWTKRTRYLPIFRVLQHTFFYYS